MLRYGNNVVTYGDKLAYDVNIKPYGGYIPVMTSKSYPGVLDVSVNLPDAGGRVPIEEWNAFDGRSSTYTGVLTPPGNPWYVPIPGFQIYMEFPAAITVSRCYVDFQIEWQSSTANGTLDIDLWDRVGDAAIGNFYEYIKPLGTAIKRYTKEIEFTPVSSTYMSLNINWGGIDDNDFPYSPSVYNLQLFE